MEQKKLLIFIPMYNCEKQITRVLGKVAKFPWAHDILLVDNISTDSTPAKAIEFLKTVTSRAVVIQNKKNVGLGGSHKVAFHYAIQNNYDYLCVLHGDDQGRIEDVLPVLQEMDQYPDVSCFLGARFIPRSHLQGYSKFRIFGNIVFNGIYSLVAGHAVFDLGSGLNLYRVAALKNQFYQNYPNNLTFNCAMLLGSYQKGLKSKFFPISWSESDQVSNVKLFSQSIDTLKIAMKFAARHAEPSDVNKIDPSLYTKLFSTADGPA